MHFDMLWVHFLNIGAWLATTPFVLGTFEQSTFSDAVMRVTQERGLWEPVLRNTALVWSDLASGVLGYVGRDNRLGAVEVASSTEERVDDVVDMTHLIGGEAR
jgi:hypothetical protein